MINLYYKFYFTIVPSYLGSILKVCRSVYEYMHHVSRSRSTWTWRNRTSFFIPKLVVFLLDFGGCREDVLHERVVLFSNFLSVDTKQKQNHDLQESDSNNTATSCTFLTKCRAPASNFARAFQQSSLATPDTCPPSCIAPAHRCSNVWWARVMWSYM